VSFVCNVVVAACTALLVPVPTIGIGLLLYDLRHEHEHASSPIAGERRRFHAPFRAVGHDRG